MTLGSQKVHRSEKSKKKKIPEKPDLPDPDPDPDFRISVHGVEIRAPRATCGQNFRPLAAILLKLTMAFEVDNYILDYS